jgi:hypothetical protein
VTGMDAAASGVESRPDVVWAGPDGTPMGDVVAWATGYAFTDTGHIEDLDIARHLVRERHRLEAAADSLNGCFAAAIFSSDGAVFITDRDGSIPLYSARRGPELVISNDPWRVVDELDTTPELDEIAVIDMIRLGYVAGQRTLARGVTIMPPATVWRVRRHQISPSRFWRLRVVPQNAPSDESRNELARALRGGAVSMAQYIRDTGRTAAMALSGGLDTRLLTALLVRERTPNLRAYSYGARGDEELETGKRIAEILGVPHDSIELEPDYLTDSFIEESVRRVGFTTRFTCGVGVRHYERTDVDLFLTGHGGCFSDFSYGVLTAPVHTRGQARNYLYWRHYQVDARDEVPRRIFDLDYDAAKFESIDESLERFDPSADAIGELYRWGLENRQRKLILMEHRLFETRGRWLLPIHDHRVTAYFMSAPRNMLLGQRAYKEVAHEVFRSISPELDAVPRIGGSMDVDPKTAIAIDVSRRLRWLTAPMFPLFARRSMAFRPSPPAPFGADPLRYWFHTNDGFRHDVLERVDALDVPFLLNRELRVALDDAVSDRMFIQMLPGAITVDAFAKLLRTRKASRARDAASR